MLKTGYMALQAASSHDNTIMGMPASLVTLVMVVIAVVILVLVVRAIASVYQKVPPEKALVIYGAGATRVISGGSSFVWPFINQSYEMNLTINQVEIELDKVPNKDKVPVNVKAVATYKISNKEDLLMKAAQNFGSAEQSANRGEDTKEVKVKHILESHLRSVISQLDLEDLLRKRDAFNQRIQNDSEPELEELGLELKSFNILHVSDNNGVIDALGRKETAKILADAEIEQASQNRRKTIETTTAQKEAETTAAQNQTLIASAQRDRDKQTLGFEADVAKQRATTEQAGPLSQAEAKKEVVKAEVQVKQTQAEAEISLQDAVRKRNEAEYQATIITKAEAERQQKVIEAEGAAKARTTMAAAEKEALENEGDGQAKKIKATGLANADVAKDTG
ncbi:MAG TPA: SPFH domain-containing protein, partial [Blastocatellia bacterium]|nr:SPFH domain-containing protein [Blastocatellia bacterium]